MIYQIQNFIHANNLRPGDAIVAKKLGYRVLDHFIIYLGEDYFGDLFMANSMYDGVQKFREDDLLTLVKDFEPVSIRRLKGGNYERNLAVQRALSQEGQPYSLFGSNCEHFANYVQSGEKKSPQVTGAFAIVAAVALVAGFINSDS